MAQPFLSVSSLHQPRGGSAFGMTDVGLVRRRNEDNFLIDQGLDLAMEADGLGNHLTDAKLPAIGIVYDAIDYANQALHRLNQEHRLSERSGMGTTLTALWRPPHDDALIIFHVGDSRLYRSRTGTLQRMTHDHTVEQQRLDAGMAASTLERMVECATGMRLPYLPHSANN